MNLAKLEAFLKSQCSGDYYELTMDLNDHKSGYCDIQKHEESYPNIKYVWVTEEQRQAAYASDEVWSLSKWGVKNAPYVSVSGSVIEAVLLFANADEEIVQEAKELAEFMKSLLKGQWTSAGITFARGQQVSRKVDGVWVNSLDNIATMIAEDENYADLEDWISEEDRQKAITDNGVWTFQWYPNTPVGSAVMYGSSLESVITNLQKLIEQGD